MKTQLTPDMLLKAYAIGIFPMAASRSDPTIHWFDPQQRGIFDLQKFHISRSLSKRIATWDYQIRVNSDFRGVVTACADREETWINPELFDLYHQLHKAGFAHSLEVWEQNELVGGVYGVAIGAAFCGESMFSRRTDASKVALAWLVHRLRAGGFTLFDTQFLTPHLKSLGAEEIPREAYLERLNDALERTAVFDPPAYAPDRHSVRQRKTQTS